MSTPDYLQKPSLDGHKWGVLEYDAQKRTFIIENGEPILLDFAKRVFPGATLHDRSKEIRFLNDRRTVQDLNWLLMRYPLEVKCQETLEDARLDAVRQYEHRSTGRDLQPIKPPKEFTGKLYGYQEEAVNFLCANGRTLLGDSMGLGKTWSALGSAAQNGKFPVLIVCPTQVQLQWQRMIGLLFDLPSRYQKGFLDSELDIARERGRHLAPILKSQTPCKIPSSPFSIIHYGLLSFWSDTLRNHGYKVVIFDEVQELRRTESYKYSASSFLSSRASEVWGLSGTPVYGYGIEIWSVMNAIDFHCLGSKEAFSREWCSGYGSKVVKNPRALHDYLTREGLLLRRKTSDVAAYLPKVVRHIQDLNQDDLVYEQLIAAAKEKAALYEGASFETKGKLAREIDRESRKAAGIAKAPYVAEFVASLVEAGERPLVYAWHHDVHDIIMDRLKDYKPSAITGRQTQVQKDDNIRRFINGRTPLVTLSLRSTAGLDGLQHRGTMCVFAELDWSPAIHSQSETRIARVGVADDISEVPSYYCVSRSGYDEVILDVLGLKTSQFVGLMGDEPEDYAEQKRAEEAAERRIKTLVDKLKRSIICKTK